MFPFCISRRIFALSWVYSNLHCLDWIQIQFAKQFPRLLTRWKVNFSNPCKYLLNPNKYLLIETKKFRSMEISKPIHISTWPYKYRHLFLNLCDKLWVLFAKSILIGSTNQRFPIKERKSWESIFICNIFPTFPGSLPLYCYFYLSIFLFGYV